MLTIIKYFLGDSMAKNIKAERIISLSIMGKISIVGMKNIKSALIKKTRISDIPNRETGIFFTQVMYASNIVDISKPALKKATMFRSQMTSNKSCVCLIYIAIVPKDKDIISAKYIMAKEKYWLLKVPS